MPSLNLANDWAVVDDLQTVTWYVKVSEGQFNSAVSVGCAYWEELNQMDYLKNPDLLNRQSRALHVWTNQLSGVVPKLSDKVVDVLGQTWYIDSIGKLDLDANGVQRYRCVLYLG